MNAATKQELRASLWPDAHDAPARLIGCRHCGQRNRVRVPDAVLDADGCRCGTCKKALFLASGEPLVGLDAVSYEHPLDHAALDNLKAVPGFPAALRWILANTSERSVWLLEMSSHVRCSDVQFPEIVALLDRACAALGVPKRPELFLGESPFANAWTVGVKEPIIGVHAGLLDQLDDTEIVAVLGHELGHLQADHILYRTMARVVLSGAAALGGLGLLATIALQKGLQKWSRCAELTCDRAGLLACRDLGASLSLLMRLSGGNRPGTTSRTRMKLAPFVAQARELARQEASNLLDGVLAALMTLDAAHPFAAWRVMHLLEWVESGSYLDILAGHYARKPGAGAG